jgi:hypothetical protein
MRVTSIICLVVACLAVSCLAHQSDEELAKKYKVCEEIKTGSNLEGGWSFMTDNEIKLDMVRAASHELLPSAYI